VFGRVTYEGMAAFWPTPAREESDPEVAKQTLPQATWAGTRIISSHAEEELAKLKQQPGQDIVIPGSPTLTAGLLQTGLFTSGNVLLYYQPTIPPPQPLTARQATAASTAG
jgi:dihydrofolate reductase